MVNQLSDILITARANITEFGKIITYGNLTSYFIQINSSNGPQFLVIRIYVYSPDVLVKFMLLVFVSWSYYIVECGHLFSVSLIILLLTT